MIQPSLRIPPLPTLRNAFCLAGALALSACAIGAHPRVDATGAGLASGTPASLNPDAGADETMLGQALQTALARHSVATAEGAGIEIRYSVSMRPSYVGIGRAVDGEVAWESVARRGYLLDRCRGERARISMAAFQRATGALLHRSTAEMDSCTITPAMLEDLAGQMVDDALSRNGQAS
ncbi:hypothetical protein GRI97_05065 [Altererythrobacter xixiisoli]|uniref:Lipoprotein n=1 Tax=Croceibacterium xixiisoli TaxID=1476466 RepID=A0A6I4TR46_9SPHN|nr:hypothetical protein [Croceibacterium xixiisoli]MXO98354.1 hypothetical protein [Croceibacterium xixiisoli]